ncbi:putative glycerophosphoryl diester phosphodiesterase precursor (GlpQ) [Mycobacterium novum]|uniref:Putative glycerophosphoryl diester phosphodiesterase (GlpQ) n=1 Tax=Mycobacterium novum TaxID=2492438 RepID=A0A7I7JMY8_9MYCO|nr:glycerophosphodiester phosphodiesterase family protein [Mycobacterium novum]BBX13247.1 putative glycerophosphoryl diester phosphodiesterase precursor (GlpQ) [Mycobacterium novum]
MIRRAAVATVAVAAVLAGSPVAAQPASFDLQAHRGGRGETTEESLRAFAKAIESGVTTLELDIVLTRDAQPLVWHDLVIEPAKCADTGPVVAADPDYPYLGKRVADLTLAQLRTLDCGQPLPEFPDAEVVRGNVIGTLPEVFALADSHRSGVRYNIETKVDGGNQRQIVEVILAAVRAGGKLDAVEIQSFDWRTLSLVRAAEPAIPLVALWERGPDPITGAAAVGADGVSPDHRIVDRAFVERAHAAGLRVVPWTVNDADAMRRQIAAGVDGFITDYPSRARAVLAESGMPLPPATG